RRRRAPCSMRWWPNGSEAESFSGVPEQRAKKWPIEAQSTAIARAMASICNDERTLFGVMSGHDRKTHSLSLSDQAARRDRDGARAARRNRWVVGDQHQGRTALAVEVEHQLDHRLAGGRIQAAGRLVGKQQRRLGDEGARQRHALLLAARE